MKALVLRGAYDIAVEERPEPQPKPGEVVVEVIATGICGSDFHGYSGENGRRHPGQVMGHETVGRVDELGPGVTDLAPGQLVTINPVMACGDLPGLPRRSAAMVQPPGGAGRGPGDSGGVRRPGRRPGANVVVLPESMPAELGALVEPLAVGLPRRASRGRHCRRPRAGHRRWPDRAGLPAGRPAARCRPTWPCPTSARRAGSCAPGSAGR